MNIYFYSTISLETNARTNQSELCCSSRGKPLDIHVSVEYLLERSAELKKQNPRVLLIVHVKPLEQTKLCLRRACLNVELKICLIPVYYVPVYVSKV